MKSLLLVFISCILLQADFKDVITIAKSKLGKPYEYGKSGENSFDCSGFVYYVYHKRLGYKLPRTSKAQSEVNATRIFNKKELLPGDLVFFDTSNKGVVNHSGIYIGDMKFIHSTSGKAYQVTISPLDRGFYKDRFMWGIRILLRVNKPLRK